jgi:hypothetical protein
MTPDQLQQWITRTGGDPEKVRTLLANVLAEVVPAQEPLPPSDKLFHYTEAKIRNKVVQTIWQRATDLSIPRPFDINIKQETHTTSCMVGGTGCS